jgi:Domain of unknown function (DUF4440)
MTLESHVPMRRIAVYALSCAFLLSAGRSLGQTPGASSPSIESPSGKHTQTEQEILKLSEQCIAAEVRGDLAAMDACFTADYTHTHAIGIVQTKAEFLDSFRTGAHKYEAIDISGARVRFYPPGTAIVEGHAHIRSVNSGHVTDASNLFTNVWVKQQGKWREATWVTVRPAPRSQ